MRGRKRALRFASFAVCCGRFGAIRPSPVALIISPIPFCAASTLTGDAHPTNWTASLKTARPSFTIQHALAPHLKQCSSFVSYRRDPKSLVKPPKNQEKEGKNGAGSKDEYNEKLKKATPKATRHLILIRHGQYEMDPESDKNRVLTALGNNSFFTTIPLPFSLTFKNRKTDSHM